MLVAEEKIRLPDGREVSAGSIGDAARLCVTARSEHGVSVSAYRLYMRTQGAPGPISVPDPVRPGRSMTVRDGAGRELYDLNAVRDWHLTRPGSGRARPGRVPARTELRAALLSEARAGRLVVEPPTVGRPRGGRVAKGDLEAAVLGPVSSQVLRTQVTALMKAGLLELPDEAGRVVLSGAGATVLDGWNPPPT